MYVIDKNGVLVYQGAMDNNEPLCMPRTGVEISSAKPWAPCLSENRLDVSQTKPYAAAVKYEIKTAFNSAKEGAVKPGPFFGRSMSAATVKSSVPGTRRPPASSNFQINWTARTTIAPRTFMDKSKLPGQRTLFPDISKNSSPRLKCNPPHHSAGCSR